MAFWPEVSFHARSRDDGKAILVAATTVVEESPGGALRAHPYMLAGDAGDHIMLREGLSMLVNARHPQQSSGAH